MKKIFWRVFISFSVVLMVFTILIGLMFTRFNRTNIVGAYKQQLGDLASGVAKRTAQAVQNSETDTFINYLMALEDFGTYQDIDIWIVTNPGAEPALDDAYTNVDIEQIIMPVETQNILNSVSQ